MPPKSGVRPPTGGGEPMTKEVSDVRATQVTLRDLPYPYCAALSITGDLDDLRTRSAFLELARFVGTREETRSGPGLGLEVSHSFWFFDATGRCDFTVFSSLEGRPSANAELIERLVRSGHIDILHTYGDFSEGGFERAHAERALAYLRERDLTVPVWVNHGGTRNTQMIGSLPEQRGDDRGSSEYHVDVMLECGIRFVERFDITHVVGQDARATLTDRVTQAAESLRYRMAGDPARASTVFANRLVFPCVLDDGTAVHCFRRFIGRERGMDAAGNVELARQLSPAVLHELVAKRGWMSVYTHPWRGATEEGVMHPSAVEALTGLAARQEAGEVWVTTTSRLLRTNTTLRGLVWKAHLLPEEILIDVERVDDEIHGERLPDVSEMSGITFYTPEPQRTSVSLGGVRLSRLVINPPDETGRASVSVPLTPLPLPELPAP